MNRYSDIRYKCKKLLAVLLLGVLLFPVASLQAERIKDIATLDGVRTNQLVGYGLVVGLNGTGDKTGATFTEQSFANMLTQLGINIPPGVKLKSKNIAAVMVTTELKSFMKRGQTMDVNISSIGDASSLRGGTLLMTPLKGTDGKVYGIAQGNVTVIGLGAQGKDGSNVTVNVPSGGRIPGGATVERDIPNPFYISTNLAYNLHSPDFTTSRRMADAINALMGPGTAKALDATTVKVTAPKKMSQRVDYVSVLENIELKPAEAAAKIIVNARTGTVVISRAVVVRPAAVSHGNIVVTISENPVISQPNAFAGGRTVVRSNSQIDIKENARRAFVFSPGASLRDLVNAINAVGATPGDLIAILQSLHQAGAVSAEIVVI